MLRTGGAYHHSSSEQHSSLQVSQRILMADSTLQLMSSAAVSLPAQMLCRLTVASVKLIHKRTQCYAHLSGCMMAVWPVVLEGHVSP